MLAGILLVGGESRRFKGYKALAHYKNKTLLEHALTTLQEASIDLLAASVSHNTPREAIRILEEYDTFLVWDEESPLPCRGPAHGIASVHEKLYADEYLIVGVDYPWLTARVLRRLYEHARRYKAEALTPVVKPGLPVNTIGYASRGALSVLARACRVKTRYGLKTRVSDLYRGALPLRLEGWSLLSPGDPCVFASVNTPGDLLACPLRGSAPFSQGITVWDAPRLYRRGLDLLWGAGLGECVEVFQAEARLWPEPAYLYGVHARRDSEALLDIVNKPDGV